MRTSCLERATWAKIGGHWALEPIGPLTGAGLSPGAGLVTAVTERLRGRTERTDVSRLLALLAGWPPDECRDALETVRGLLPRTAAVRVLTAWRDLESLPALRRAAADGGLYERFMVARMTRDLRDYHRVLDAGPDESCLPELIASWPEPGDPRLVELCRRLCRIPDDARPPAQRARVAAMAGLVEAGDDVGRHLPALLSLIAADPRVFDAQALLRRWRREGRLGVAALGEALGVPAVTGRELPETLARSWAVVSDRSSVLDEGMIAGCVGIVWDPRARPDTDRYRARHEAIGAIGADTSAQVHQAVGDVVAGRVTAPEDLLLLDAGACARLTAQLRRDVI